MLQFGPQIFYVAEYPRGLILDRDDLGSFLEVLQPVLGLPQADGYRITLILDEV